MDGDMELPFLKKSMQRGQRLVTSSHGNGGDYTEACTEFDDSVPVWSTEIYFLLLYLQIRKDGIWSWRGYGLGHCCTIGKDLMRELYLVVGRLDGGFVAGCGET